jgi:hypothetical protein
MVELPPPEDDFEIGSTLVVTHLPKLFAEIDHVSLLGCNLSRSLAFGLQLIEILMDPRYVWLHGKHNPSSRCVFGLL